MPVSGVTISSSYENANGAYNAYKRSGWDKDFFEANCSLTVMGANDVSGIVCLMTGSEEGGTLARMYNAAEKSGVPVVFLSEIPPEGNSRFDQINLNDRSGMEQVVNHLAALGHTRIGFIGERLCVGRLNNLISLLKERSPDICDSHVKIGEMRFEAGGYEQMMLLLEEPDLPTAVIAGYDQMAFGALKAVWEAGLDVPEDFSLVGFDNVAQDEYLPRKLTSVANHVNSMAQIATQLLFNRIDYAGETVTQTVFLHPTLMVRETTRPVK